MQKVVLITGGSKGIGKATGQLLSENGFKVYGTSRNPDTISNHPFKLLPLDVTDPNSIARCIDLLKSETSRLDILINNAGAGITGPIEEIPEAEIKKNFETNFFGPVAMIKSVLPLMRENKSGLIINVTSIAGYMGLPFRGVYSASKGALELITEAISMEVKSFGIDVVNFAPGDVATDIAAGRYHSPLKESSAYKATYGKTLELMDTHVDSGKDPMFIANAIYNIITSKSRKVHYKAGEPLQKFSIVLKRLLPDRWYEKMLMNHYKL
ncbi:SDR family oxidoreductase [Winogradskyella aurantiaca]|uniref:SDR family oxidoreductase n=1 Tax=Winogradskyella aurantiaca TaxID=2219558 RepID=UPI000E1D61A3|nr:SDR family oxidoreductase [Winogradskyella aurantiaca]